MKKRFFIFILPDNTWIGNNGSIWTEVQRFQESWIFDSIESCERIKDDFQLAHQTWIILEWH